MEDTNNISSIIAMLGAIFVAIEVLMGAPLGFELLILGVILLIASIVMFFTGSIYITIAVAVCLILFYIFYARSQVRSYLAVNTLNTNVDALIGEKAIVIEEISAKAVGKIKINGEIWRAQSNKLCLKNSCVKIISVSGVTLKVEPVS